MSQKHRTPKSTGFPDEPLSPEQRERNREAAALLRSWMELDGQYEEEVWPLIEEELKNNRVRCGE